MAKYLINLSFLAAKPTGIDYYAEEVVHHLPEADITLLTRSPRETNNCYVIQSLKEGQASGESNFKRHLRRLYWTQFKLPKLYQQLRSNLLFSPVPEAPLWSNCRHVVTVHDCIPLRFPRKTSPLIPYHKYYIPQVVKQAEHVICNSEATARDIQRFYGVTASKITPILLGYNSQHFYPRRREFLSPALGDRLGGLPSYFLYIGRCDPHKNIARMITAFAELQRGNTWGQDLQLYLLGATDDRHTPVLRQQIAALGLAEQVKFLDYVPYGQLPELISGAIALVFPSLWEGFGLPILEAMACGTPVITSNIASMPEVAGDAAILVNPYNTLEIADAMGAIATDNQLRDKLSTLGLARVRQFSWKKTAQQTEEILHQFC